jgi:hypothetical protein
MKYIITEQQLNSTLKKYDKEKNRGKYSNVIEGLVLSMFKGPICDVVALKVQDSDEDYVVLILTPNSYMMEYSQKIGRNIENLVGIYPTVIITQSQNCEENNSDDN